MMGGMTRSFIVVIVSAVLGATILAFWTDPDNLSDDQRASVLQPAQSTSAAVLVATPTTLATPNYLLRIGIVSGHAGPENDPGAVCPDGLTEAEINRAVALRVVQDLRERGYNVDLLDEFDERLEGYEAAALVSIHSNDCTDYGEFVSGYLVSQAEARAEGGPDTRLRECVAAAYGEGTGLDRRFGLTRDMTDYHIFRSIHPRTPGIIVELGFMLGDREMLTTQPDMIAESIATGVLCFLETPANEFVPTPDLVTLTPVPTDTPVSVP
jgi:N-acetylmuramoyl-L-alanine amidase